MIEAFTVEELKGELAQLQRARRGGSQTVTYKANGIERTVTYRRDAELLAAIADLEKRIEELEGTGRPQNVVVRGNRGWLT